jgi:hypothetical protein
MVIDCVINLYHLFSSIFHGLKALPLLFWLYTKSSKKDGARFWNYLPDLITILVIIFVFRYIKRIHYLKCEIEKGI